MCESSRFSAGVIFPWDVYGRERQRRFLLGLGHRDRQGLDQLLPRDDPPVQLDLRGLQHLSQPRDFHPQLAAAVRTSNIPSTDATAYPSVIKRTQDAAYVPHPERNHV